MKTNENINNFKERVTDLENQIINLARILPSLSKETSQKLESILDQAYSALVNDRITLARKQTKLAQKYLNDINQTGGTRVTPQEIKYTHDRIEELESTAERNNSDLLDRIRSFHNQFDMAMNMGFLSDRDLLTATQQQYSELHALLNQPKFKRCRNKTAPITTEDVEDVAPEDLIVFSNGACWDIEALISFLKSPAPGGANGQNNAELIKRHLSDYPSDKIWSNSNDYQQMIKHPKAVAADLDRFIKEHQFADLAKQISDTTTRLLYKNGSLLLSRGEPFKEALRMHLNPTQMIEWDRIKSGLTLHELPPEIKNPKTTVQAELATIIKDVIKTEAIAELLGHLDTTPAKERQALETIREGFMNTLRSCYRGEYCSLATGDMIVSVYNKIFPFKSGFEPIEK